MPSSFIAISIVKLDKYHNDSDDYSVEVYGKSPWLTFRALAQIVGSKIKTNSQQW